MVVLDEVIGDQTRIDLYGAAVCVAHQPTSSRSAWLAKSAWSFEGLQRGLCARTAAFAAAKSARVFAARALAPLTAGGAGGVAVTGLEQPAAQSVTASAIESRTPELAFTTCPRSVPTNVWRFSG